MTVTNGTFSFTTSPPRDPRKRHDQADPRTSHHITGAGGFIGVDGEGMRVFVCDSAGIIERKHVYVLLGIGQEQVQASNIADGLDFLTIIEFLYSHYRPSCAFVGFFLGYDFTQWFASLPESRARMLLTAEGRKSRTRRDLRNPALRLPPHPVNYGPWQFDMLGTKRLKIRRRDCECILSVCEHVKGPWMYICDVGAYFQTSFLNVINPAKWPEPIVSPGEYAAIEEGKARRDSAMLDEDMRFYNRLENEVLGRVMAQYDTGLRNIGVALSPSKWFGPGQAAQTWLKGRAPQREDIANAVPAWFLDICKSAYFGGWFEIFMHGLVPGNSHEYDINSAYPAIITDLPCLLHGTYERGHGRIPPNTSGRRRIGLVRAHVWTQSYRDRPGPVPVGAMLHRDRNGRISRPIMTEGWFHEEELDAAREAGCVVRIRSDRYIEWAAYYPCNCPPPLREMADLYIERLRVGKDTPFGKGSKTVYNSGYGKFAQSIGEPMFGNAVYAAAITSGCRTRILGAIATHPGGVDNVAMVATDAVFFLDPHPGLRVSDRLGDWSYAERSNLTLFKPGVYWDDTARAKVAAGAVATFKARGINAADFSRELARIDDEFRSWSSDPPPIQDDSTGEKVSGWPEVEFAPSFAMVSALQALMRNDWSQAGLVESPGQKVTQSSNPHQKRTGIRYDPVRGVYRSEAPWFGQGSGWHRRNGENVLQVRSSPYAKRFGMEDPWSEESLSQWGIDYDGYVGDAYRFLVGKD